MSKEGGPIGFLEGLVHTSHTITLVLGFIGIGSLQALITQYFEPLIEVYWSFLLTFPLTLGLTILFLFLFNSKFEKIPLSNFLATPILVFFLFWILNSIADKYKFTELAEAHEPKEKETVSHHKTVTYYEGIKEPSDPWYKNVAILRAAISSSYGLVNMFINFYHVYKPLRFFSGIVLALFFTFFIQTKIIKPYRSGKNKIANAGTGSGAH